MVWLSVLRWIIAIVVRTGKEKEERFRMKKSLLHILTAVLLALMMIPTNIGMAYAEEAPAEIQDLYTIDGVNYYNTGSDSFDQSQYQYFKEVLGNGSGQLTWDGVQSGYKRSMSDLWLETAAGLMYGKDYFDNGRFVVAMDKAVCQGSNYKSFNIGNENVDTWTYAMDDMKSTDMQSLKSAEQYIYNVAGISKSQSGTGYFKSNDKEQKVAAAAVKAMTSDGDYRVAAVYFTNFKVLALFPEDVGKNYVTTMEKNDTTYSNAVASTVRNNSATTVTGSQKVSNSYTASSTSSVSGSETYTYQEGIKVGNEFSEGFFHKFSVELSFTATQAFQDGWSDSKSVSDSNGSEQSVSVNMPPYTNVMISQKTTNAEATIKYNCPVGVTFDTTVVIYDKDGVRSSSVTGTQMVFSFTGTARKELASRYNEWKGEDVRTDEEGILWYYVTAFDSTGDTHVAEAINKASTYVPIAPTGAQFRDKMKLVSTEIDGVMPILPLTKVKLDSLNIPRYEDSGSYNSYNYLSMKMPVGDSTYTKYFALSGYNGNDVPYFGFSKDFGTWKVVDENGNEWTDSDAPVQMGKETVSGYSTINAVKPGVCYLKYFIDEKTYNTASNPDHFTTNDELTSTAVIKLTVTDDRTIEVTGSFEGYADTDPEAIDGEGKLQAAVMDASGKEVNAEVTWEAKEKDGIIISENMVSFTKPGTYHVRACSGSIHSEWVEITAGERHVHELEEIAAAEATCDTDGNRAHFACKTCGKLFSDAEATTELALEDVMLPGGHQMVCTKRKAATCTALGNIKYYTCGVCGEIYRDKNGAEELSEGDLTLPALGHDWTEWETEKEATESEEGLQSRFCRNDTSHKQTMILPVIPHKHTIVKTNKVQPTCTEEGNIAYYTCSECGWVFTDPAGNNEISPEDVILPTTGHVWDPGNIIKKATVTSEGEIVYTCTACGEQKTESIAKLAKKANPLSLSGKTATIKYKKLKKKTQTMAVTKVINFTKQAGDTKTYTLSSAKKGKKSFKKYFNINKTTGKVTIKKNKKMKKGTYNVTVKVKASGNSTYKASSVKTVTFKIKVK